MLGQNIYYFYSSSSFCLKYNLPGTAFSSEMKRLCQKPCKATVFSFLHLIFPVLFLPFLAGRLHVFPFENECYPIPSLQSMCSKRRESLRVWVNFIPGTEPCLFPEEQGREVQLLFLLLLKGNEWWSIHFINLKEFCIKESDNILSPCYTHIKCFKVFIWWCLRCYY